MIRVYGVGEVAFDPEMKTGSKGQFLTFKIRTGKMLPDGRIIQNYTRCVMFGERGQTAAKRIRVGAMVSVDGELSTRKDDQGREWTSVKVDHLGVPAHDCAQQPKSDRGYWGDPNAKPQYAQVQPQQTAPPQYTQAPPVDAYRDDDIPF